MREADLERAHAHGASLRDLDLSAANLRDADLSDADLRGSDLHGIEPHRTNLQGAVVALEQAVTVAEALGLDVRAD